jgi:hypothetical protein
VVDRVILYDLQQCGGDHVHTTSPATAISCQRATSASLNY